MLASPPAASATLRVQVLILNATFLRPRPQLTPALSNHTSVLPVTRAEP